MIKIGVMTFHASHNFGSVMQAWATLAAIRRIDGYEAEIINFRPYSQKDKYSVFPIKSGIKVLLQNLVNIRFIVKKCRAHEKYERFINTKLSVTKEINEIKDLKFVKRYDIFLSGSDQIWGYKIPEFVLSKEEIRGAYYFDFVNGYKISYGSSTGISTLEELKQFKDCLNEYKYISVREESGRNIVHSLTGKTVKVVLDPTYLVSHNEWVQQASKTTRVVEGDYYLIYSLQGLKKARQWKEIIKKIQYRKHIRFVTIVPFAPIKGLDIMEKSDAGPDEILNLFANAKFVFTDTFHGLSFSIHFRKHFALYEKTPADYRKRNILSLFHLSQRETSDLQTCISMTDEPIDYEIIEPIIAHEIDKSMAYLMNALTSYNTHAENTI